MIRRPYNIAVVTLLVLFVVVMGLWVYSYWYSEIISYSLLNKNVNLISTRGELAATVDMNYHASFSWRRKKLNPPYPVWMGSGLYYAHGFGVFNQPISRPGYPTSKVYGFILPYWFLAILTLILPVIWLIRRQRKRDPDAVPCVKCGYDLRESRGTCPECGEPVPVPG